MFKLTKFLISYSNNRIVNPIMQFKLTFAEYDPKKIYICNEEQDIDGDRVWCIYEIINLNN